MGGNMGQKIVSIRLVIVGIGAWIGDVFGVMWQTLLLLFLLMVVDYISGMLAAKKEALEHPDNCLYGWSSKKSVMGIYKKAGYILTILVAVSTDYILFYFSDKMEWDMPTKTLFGLLITLWFVINELLSILENVGRMGVMLPDILYKVLTELKNNTEEKR